LKSVGVVVPCNDGRFLADTLKSIKSQSYPLGRVLVVDDESKNDLIRTICSDIGVEWFKIEHVGRFTPANAMNVGLKLLDYKYDFVCFVGADDILSPDYIKKCLDGFVSDKVGFVWTACQEFGSRDNVRIPYYRVMNKWNCYRNPSGQLGASLFRVNALQGVGFDVNLEGLEDWDLVIRLCKCGWIGVAVNDILYFARVHDSNLSFRVNYDNLFDKHFGMRFYQNFSGWFRRIAHPVRSVRRLRSKLASRFC
jgi:cellulose synthase/poly-beta-1,6-N-acetylglucosamine synthase-like glycosyltransferase